MFFIWSSKVFGLIIFPSTILEVNLTAKTNFFFDLKRICIALKSYLGCLVLKRSIIKCLRGEADCDIDLRSSLA